LRSQADRRCSRQPLFGRFAFDNPFAVAGSCPLPFSTQDSLDGLLARLWPCEIRWVSISSFKEASDSSYSLALGLSWHNTDSVGEAFFITCVAIQYELAQLRLGTWFYWILFTAPSDDSCLP